jgi:hypothetical protein
VREIPIEGVTLGFVKEFCKSGMVGIVDGGKKVLRIEEGVGSWLLYPEAPMYEAGDIALSVGVHQPKIPLFLLSCPVLLYLT